ncbi:hypothetical protein [Sphingobium aquiterrae]|uniref:hypothetical protein n=1 Tax=Sphingobium aquiterrae TaxID=2038656 RepID=UPI003016E7E6
MLEEIIQDNLNRVLASNQPIFSSEFDYDDIVAKKDMAAQKWNQFSGAERAEYRDLSDFELKQGVRDPKDQALIPAKNTSLLLKEIRSRLDREDPIKPLAIETLDFEDAMIELAESLENSSEIRDLYRLRKASSGSGKKSGINLEEATRLKNCFSQGRELYLAGRNGSLMRPVCGWL